MDGSGKRVPREWRFVGVDPMKSVEALMLAIQCGKDIIDGKAAGGQAVSNTHTRPPIGYQGVVPCSIRSM